VTLYGGDVVEAERLLSESLNFCLEVRNKFDLAHVYTYLADWALWGGKVEQAGQCLAQSLAYHADAQRITIDELQRIFVAARLATMQGQYQRAAVLLGVGEAAHHRIHNVYAGPMLPLVNAALLKVREALGAKLFDEAFAAGQQLSINEAYTTLLPPAYLRNIVTLSTPT
jgi:hypothetical protein